MAYIECMNDALKCHYALHSACISVLRYAEIMNPRRLLLEKNMMVSFSLYTLLLMAPGHSMIIMIIIL